MNRERIERLLHVLDVAAATAKRRDDESGGDRLDMATWGEETACGFAGCAVGWASRDAWFKREGLEVKYSSVLVRGHDTGSQYGDLASFFGATIDECIYLFAPFTDDDRSRYTTDTPCTVSARVREVAARYGHVFAALPRCARYTPSDDAALAGALAPDAGR